MKNDITTTMVTTAQSSHVTVSFVAAVRLRAVLATIRRAISGSVVWSPSAC